MSPNQAPVSPKPVITTIVLTGGGSGGHITPLLSLAHELKKKQPKCKIIYIGLKGEKVEGLQARFDAFDEVRRITAGKFRRYHGESFLAHVADVRTWLLNIGDFFKVIAGTWSARRLIKQFKPAVVFSKGGFVGVPVGIAAHLGRVPIVTHDSDAIEGLSNKIIGRWAAVHATGMPPIYYKYPPASVRYVGVPINELIVPVDNQRQATFKRELDLPADSLVLLVGGAGLGARSINQKIVQLSPELLGQVKSLHIIHITGAQHEAAVQERYRQALTEEQLARVRVLGFTLDFYKYTGAADLVITRAGATTLAELAVQKKAVLLIPAPFLTGGHQLKNAEQLKKNQAAEVVSNNVEPAKLLEVISELLKNQSKRSKLATNLAATARPQAAADLANIILETATLAR